MLLTLEWQPWFSYGWWHDIGVPFFGALGSIAVGAGAIIVAFRSSRIAEDAAKSAAAARESELASADRAVRYGFSKPALDWYDTELFVRAARPGSTARKVLAREALEKRKALDLQAANIGQLSASLLAALASNAKSVIPGDSTEHQNLASIMRSIGHDSVRAWIDDPERWLETENASNDFKRKWSGDQNADGSDWGYEKLPKPNQ